MRNARPPGIAAGSVVAVFVARAMGGLLYGTASFDLLTFAVSALALLAVTFGAGLTPARRVASVDPVCALRHD